jgi:hypothetical protein
VNSSQGEGHRCDRCPPGEYEVGWEYLLPEQRLTRIVDSLELLTLQRAHRTIDIDLQLPNIAVPSSALWYVPAAFLEKAPIAPDLQVVAGDGAAIPVPTKRECMALTARAVAGLADAGKIDLGDGEELESLIWQVISSVPFDARIVRAIAESEMGPEKNGLLQSLVQRLEDRYLLWVPVEGEPFSQHRISISRRQPLWRNPIFPRSIKRETKVIATDVGSAHVAFESAIGPRYPDPFAAIDRLMQVFGFVPLVHEQEVPDAARAASFHLRVSAPAGFVVREIELDTADESERLADAVEGHDSPHDHPDVTRQGHESELAHLHCARETNHSSLIMYTSFGIRDGLTTLWASAVVFTAILLWAFHRVAPYPVHGSRAGSLEVAGAVLLVAPALASAWAIRADQNETLEKFLLGARTLLLASATLAVLAALSLVGIHPGDPGGWSDERAMGVYATAAYVAAIPLVVGWTVSQRSTWFFYRQVLTTPPRNLFAIAAIAVVCLLVCVHDNPGAGGLGLLLLAAAVAYAAIAANRAGGTSVRGRLYPPLACFGVVSASAVAGRYVGLYASGLSASDVHLGLLISQGVLFVAAISMALLYATGIYRQPSN